MALFGAVKERNELLPGLIEAVKGFEPGHTKLTENLLESRAISMRTADPAALVGLSMISIGVWFRSRIS